MTCHQAGRTAAPRSGISQPVEEDHAVTIRERDSMAQVRVPIEGLVDALRERLVDVG